MRFRPPDGRRWLLGGFLLLNLKWCCWGQSCSQEYSILPQFRSGDHDSTTEQDSITVYEKMGVQPNTTLQTLHIAGLFDLPSFPRWPQHLMDFTIRLINNHSDGWHDDVLTDAYLVSSMSNSACDPNTAVRAYFKLMRQPNNTPCVLFGCRCSGASMAVASLATVENIAMVSPISTSIKLSNKEDYPTFSRTIAPDRTGQVAALVQLLRSFGWKRISILNTDTQFTQDIAIELTEAWKGKHDGGNEQFRGEVGYSATIKLNHTSEEVDAQSVRRVLEAFPVNNPKANSKIIVLFAHHQHAFPILKIAKSMEFQPDTVWIGAGDWASRYPVDGDTSWMPPIPGYLGIIPYRNRTSPQFIDYLQRLRQYEKDNNLSVTEDFSDFLKFNFPDSILAIAKGLSAVPKDSRYNGTLVSEEIRKVEFDGVSGPIAFDDNGDLKTPLYAVTSLSNSSIGWARIGIVTPESAQINFDEACFAVLGCGNGIPEDTIPSDVDLLPFWIWMIVATLGFSCMLLIFQGQKHRTVTDKLRQIEEELKSLESDDDAVKRRKGKLYKEIADLLGQPAPEHWTDQEGLVEVEPTAKEYWDVLAQLRATMNEGESCHLSKLCRIQNLGIFSYYVFQKNQLANKYGADLNDVEQLKELHVWHGTSSLNPDVIYSDQSDGFKMQLAQQRQWGRGIYFSQRSGYCDAYSFKPFTEYSDGPQEDRELFLVKLLVGESILLDRNDGPWMENACKNLLAPPDNPDRKGLKFDTVEGEVDDEAKTRIFVVYENGRAYPEYLVRYYKGERDRTRTPYLSLEEALMSNSELEEAQKHAKEHATNSAVVRPGKDDDSVASVVSVQAVWQFLNDDEEWENYLNGHQIQIEEAFQKDRTGIVTLENFPWTYAIDFTVNLQTNLDHPGKKSRKVRRIYLGGGM